MTSVLIGFLILAAQPATDFSVPTEYVDLIEENHYYDENGVRLLDQAIFYEWDAREARYQVRAWRMIKDDARKPRPADGGYEMTWAEGGRYLRVVAPKYRETWTQYDPELLERKHLPSDQRRGLFRD